MTSRPKRLTPDVIYRHPEGAVYVKQKNNTTTASMMLFARDYITWGPTDTGALLWHVNLLFKLAPSSAFASLRDLQAGLLETLQSKLKGEICSYADGLLVRWRPPKLRPRRARRVRRHAAVCSRPQPIAPTVPRHHCCDMHSIRYNSRTTAALRPVPPTLHDNSATTLAANAVFAP